MKATKQLKIDAVVDEQLQAAARHFSLKKKTFAQEAILYFARDLISPKDYRPGREFDQVQLIRKSTERIIGFMESQDRELCSALLAEILRNQVAIQALINLVVDSAVEPGRQAAVAERVQEYIHQHMEQLKSAPEPTKKLE
jgi:hypothetical protein